MKNEPKNDNDKIVEVLPENIVKEAEKKKVPKAFLKQVAVSVHESFSGPLPPPHIFKQYPREVQKVILDQASSQVKHRQKIENKVINSNIKNANKGMNFAFILSVILLAGGIYLLANDKTIEGLALAGGTSLFHAGNYLIQRFKESGKIKKEFEEESENQVSGE